MKHSGLLVCCALIASVTTAQSPFTPPDLKGAQLQSGTLIDMDADGDLDQGTIYGELLLNESVDGLVFTPAGPPFPAEAVNGHVADIDLDGYSDVLISWPSTPLWYQNDQSLNFVPIDIGLDSRSRAYATSDFDLDGDIDILALSTTAGALLYTQQPGSTFVDETATRLPPLPFTPYAVRVADVNADGVDDLLLLAGVGERVFLINDGTGHFAVSGATIPAPPALHIVEFADIDGDGVVDLLTRTVGAFSVGQVHINDGTGTFVNQTASRLPFFWFPQSFSLDVGDLDGDGDNDIVSDGVFLNDGTGVFTPMPNDRFLTGLLVDYDGDGDLDLQATTHGLMSNDGSAKFTTRGVGNWLNFRVETERVDRNGDGIEDIVLHASNEIALDVSIRAVGRGLHDFDGDGHHDLYEVQPPRVFFGNGNGEFLGALHNVPYRLNDSAIGDVDGDGYPDVLAAVKNHAVSNPTPRPPVLFRNDGTGRLVNASSQLPLDTLSTTDVALGDVDGDGDLDAVLATGSSDGMHAPGPMRLYINFGGGVFVDLTPIQMPGVIDNFASCEFADLDGDGDLDLVIGVRDAAAHYYQNDGFGFFTDLGGASIPVFGQGSGLVPADIDDDGDIDVVGPFEIACNDGSGNFTVIGQNHFPPIRVVDIDEDGDLDVLRSLTSPPLVRVTGANRTRHLSAPQLARPGEPYELRVESLLGALVAIPFVGFFPTRLETDFGLLRVDPAVLIPLPNLNLVNQGFANEATLTLPLPLDNSLIDGTFYAQALVIEGADLRLTNHIVEQVMP